MQWKPVKGFEGVYEVSDYGHVRLLENRHNMKARSLTKQTPDRDGYLYTSLWKRSQSRNKSYHVARLIADAFIGIPSGYQVNHINGIRDDNRLCNLEVVTPEENIEHAVEKLGRDYKGEKNPSAKLTENDVVHIRERAQTGEPYKKIADTYNMSDVTIMKIARGQTWKNAPGPIITYRPLGRRPSK